MVSLSCPIAAPLDDVYMVLWFRDNAGIPLYSFDVRDKSKPDSLQHWSAPDAFGPRAHFNFNSSPASLDIKDIKRHDQGIYRCRVDFRTSQTQSFRYNLSVIILPEQPIILDRWGRQLNGTMLGPKQEGDDIVITCRVVGGRPQPQVRWLVNGLLVDNQYEHNSGDVIENRLLWPSVQRTDLQSVFTCQAINTLLVKPKEKSFILDMHLKPLTVKIIDPPVSMVADRRYEVICESSGSRPNAIITWYKGKRQLRRTRDEILNNNVSRSELSFVPTTDDDGKSITCRSENPNVTGLFLETLWKLNVVYPPLVTLRLGSTLSPVDIKEGDDVYFECHVQSNPQWRKLLWLHNGIHLEHNTSARVIRSNQSLVLQAITRHNAGNYACSAINDEGETVSNHLPLRVKYAPICKHMDRVILIGASKDETVEVSCEIQADPPPRSFRWKFNNSGETLDVGSERFSTNGSRSILKYTPVTDQDYGTLSCWAINEVGTQRQPCMFQVVLAGLPSIVNNCTVYNKTDLSVEIQCIPGYDGGLPQIFVLEMVSIKTGITRFNLTNPDEPQFLLDNLDTLTTMMTSENNSLKVRIYAVNQKGRSLGYQINDFIIGSTTHKTEDDNSFGLSPILVGIVLTIIVISLAVALRIFIVTFLQNLRRNREMQGTKCAPGSSVTQTVKNDSFKSGNLDKPRWQHTDIKTKSVADEIVEDERDPDVIPQYVGAGITSTSSTEHHYTPPPLTKWSPNNPNHAIFDTVLQANVMNSNTTTIPHAYSQLNQRGGVNANVSGVGVGVGPMPILNGTLPSSRNSMHNMGIISPNSNSNLSITCGISGGGVIGGSGNINNTTSGITTNVIQNALAATTGGLTGSGSSNLIHTGTISSNMNPHHRTTITTGVGGSGGSGGGGNSGIISSSGGSGGGTLGRLLPTIQQHSNSGNYITTTTTNSTLNNTINNLNNNNGSLNDLEDNININAIKDCLMTQRVPESCV
ncbi:uncharacterized protein LOC129612415 [Condylostylus longicornis]|uniref:uncharacterized protein LOC129612415 n=1 Tax=Condylostylus longicornis TaxID=2530218 RepID=UPI00244DDB1E|nr:uncharacterized protein LOC129612415 [Condylostylus longicornis]